MAIIAIYAIIQGATEYQILVVALMSLAAYELSTFAKSPKASLVIIPLSVLLLILYPSTLILFYLIPVISLFLFRLNKYENSFYLVILLMCSIYLLGIRDTGKFYITWICITAILTDTGGFFFGKLIGGRKLLKKISPNKTWSGAFGGWFLALLGSLLLFSNFYTSEMTYVEILTITFFMSISSQIGDMFESYLKRQANIKDSSNLIPGHGGVLDRLDSIIGASLFFMLYQSYLT